MNNKRSILTSSIILLAFTFLFSFNGCGKKDSTTTTTGDNKSDTKTTSKDEGVSPDKAYYVEYQMTHEDKTTSSGTFKIYFSGKRFRSESNMDVAGQKMTMAAFYAGSDTVYMVSDFGGKKSGVKFAKSAYGKNADQVDFSSLKDKLKTMDKIGEETILDKKCDIYKDKEKNTTFSVYNEQIPLKFTASGGKTVFVATKFDTDAKVTDDMFVPPSDVSFTDGSDMMKDLGKNPNNMQDMKDKIKEMQEQMKNYKK